MADISSCTAIEQQLVSLEGMIGPDIHRRTLDTDAWLKLVKQEPWPDEMGDELSVMVYERSLPANPMTWTNIGQSPMHGGAGGDPGGTCLPDTQIIPFAQTLRQYNLQHAALESPRLCINDLRVAFKRKEQLANMMQVLTENTSYAWVERYRDEYVRIATHKIIAAAGLPEGSSSFPLTQPTSQLTQGILRNIYMKLIRDGGNSVPLSRENGRPVFGLMTDSVTSDNLIKLNEAIRTDYRYSTKVNELLAPLGIERSYNGFYHLINDFGPRYDFVSGAWLRRYPYEGVAASFGDGLEISDEYENAEFMDSIIWVEDVYHSVIPAPITSPGGNTKFDAVSYRGDFKWKNIEHEVCNPDKNIGYFRGVFSNGSKPIAPYHGYVVRHRRCEDSLDLLECS